MLSTRVFKHELMVYYEDTDFTGYVFHPNFLKYFDRAREEFFGVERLRVLYSAGKHFVVKSAALEYKSPVKHGMRLLIRTHAEFNRSPLLLFKHDVLEQGSNIVRVLGKVELVYVNERGYPLRLGDEIYPHLQDLCSSKH